MDNHKELKEEYNKMRKRRVTKSQDENTALRQAILDAQNCGALDLNSVQFSLVMKLGLCERAMQALSDLGLSDGNEAYFLHDISTGVPTARPDSNEDDQENYEKN